MDLKASIRTVPHWPIQGVMFRDITTMLQDPAALRASCDQLYQRYKDMSVDKIVGIDARGFIFGAVLAYKLNIGFVPVRKKDKLPPPTISAAYTLEYGENVVEMPAEGITKGQKVIIIDDLIATGGTAAAAVKLVEQSGGEVLECGFVIELPDLKGREQLQGHKIFALLEFEGD